MHGRQCAWHKLPQQKFVVEQKLISQIAVGMIHSTVFPTTNCFVRLHCHAQKKWTWYNSGCWMLRFVVGRVPIPYAPSEITMRRRNQRMEHAVSLHLVQSWSNQFFLTATIWHLRLLEIALIRLPKNKSG